MARILNKQDVLEMIYGTCLMGGGGGGSLDNGIQILDDVDARIGINLKMLSVDEVEKGKYVATCGGMGSPLRFKERGANCLTEPISAFRGLERVALSMNRPIYYMMGLEYGALNTILPFMVAQECGIPLVDADGTGRAAPSIQTLLYGVNEIPIAPFVMTDGEENETITYPHDCLNAAYLDVVGRYMCQASDMVMGVGFGICSAEEIKTKLVPNAYTHAQEVGRALLKAKNEGADVMEELKKVTKCKEFFRGKLTKFVADSKGGWDFGAVYFDGLKGYEGKQFHIDYQNESLVVWAGGTVLMTAPDLICAVNLDTCEPISNADFREGMNVLVLGIPVHENWFLSDRGLDCWQYHFDTIGYTGKIVRF